MANSPPSTAPVQPVGIIGGSAVDPGAPAYAIARAIAKELARHGLPILCGGRGGVMEAACLGAREGGGLAIGLLPGTDVSAGNPYAGIVIPTGLGNASDPATRAPVTISRNWVIAQGAACLVAVAGGVGTRDEIELGLRFGKRIFAICDAPVPADADPAIAVYDADSHAALCVDVLAAYARGAD